MAAALETTPSGDPDVTKTARNLHSRALVSPARHEQSKRWSPCRSEPSHWRVQRRAGPLRGRNPRRIEEESARVGESRQLGKGRLLSSPSPFLPTSTAETQELRRELALLRAQNEKLASELNSLRTQFGTPLSSSVEEENIDRELPTPIESRVTALETQVTAIETQLADLPKIIHDTITRQMYSVITQRVGPMRYDNRPSKSNRVIPDESDFSEDSCTSAPGTSGLGSVNVTPPSSRARASQPLTLTQWNCRGLKDRKKRAHLRLYLETLEFLVAVVALQEPGAGVKLTNYTTFQHNPQTCILVHKQYTAQEVTLPTTPPFSYTMVSMSGRNTWRLFRALIDPTQTRTETQRHLHRVMQNFTGTTAQLAHTLRHRYLCTTKDPRTTAYSYAGKENTELDTPFQLHDLRAALSKMKRGTAPGRDKVTVKLLANLPDKAYAALLKYINNIGTEHKQEVGTDVALMDLVNDDVRHSLQFDVLLQGPQQDARCTEEFASTARQQLLRVTDMEDDGVAQLQ
ncbi:hypothetical protein HPB49_006650 [Dermacentor silvarum]|uniref:Uncharacterized protein n=1 Tax=Dermacentor silvarum TaxID=543639 RepID=A0ACB8DW78_DERSI|nr:hypothetical protein HPB49_006650 [Dermacentor silvarum]